MTLLPTLALSLLCAAPIPARPAAQPAPLADAVLLAALRGESLEARLTAIDALADRRAAATIPYLAALALRRDEPPVLRSAAAAALGASGHPVAGRYLSVLLSDPSIEVRCAAAESLAGLGAASVEELQRVAMTDPNREVRASAAQALGAIATPRAASALEIVTTDVDAAVQIVTAHGLQKTPLRDPHAQAFLDEQ
jgi:hypothetical protein